MQQVMSRVAVLVLTVLALSVGMAGPADAAVYTSSGVRCTKVGTSGANTLDGTSGRDVICGLGGNDVIRGHGGNDVIDGGSGNDRIDGGAGSDVVLGGSGSDIASGSSGTDRIYGGYGSDRLSGGDQGDYVSGGGDQDTLTGGLGPDSLLGGYGNDDLDGNSGADANNGGPGTNWCTIDAADTSRTRCVYDLQPATAVGYELSRSTVDVTLGAQRVDVRVHVTDDTGVRFVQLGAQDNDAANSINIGSTSLVSGTVRNGWWHATAYVPRYLPPTTMYLAVNMTDRVGRMSYHQFNDVLTILDRTPDTTAPSAVDLRVFSSTNLVTNESPVDVRSSTRSVTVKAHLTDDRSGVGIVYACLYAPSSDGYSQSGGCPGMEMTSGTTRDGWFKATVDIPARSVGGDWNVSIWLTDEAHPNVTGYWMGPDLFREWNGCTGGCDPHYYALPGGKGRFPVLGSSDSVAPALVSVTASPTTVDTLPGPATVRVRVHTTDPEGVTQVGIYPYAIDSDGTEPSLGVYNETSPSSGSRTDGWWSFDVTVPQGTPPGSFGLQVVWEDITHWRSALTVTNPGWPDSTLLTPTQLGDWDGRITVVPHP